MRFSHLINVAEAISVILDGRVTSVSLSHWKKALAAIDVTLSGITMLVILLQSPKAYSPMPITLFGITTSATLLSSKAQSAINFVPSLIFAFLIVFYYLCKEIDTFL